MSMPAMLGGRGIWSWSDLHCFGDDLRTTMVTAKHNNVMRGHGFMWMGMVMVTGEGKRREETDSGEYCFCVAFCRGGGGELDYPTSGIA